jgi:hypothetical protein
MLATPFGLYHSYRLREVPKPSHEIRHCDSSVALHVHGSVHLVDVPQ